MSMRSEEAKLAEQIFDEKIATAPTRDGFGKGTIEAGKANPNVVVLCADLAESTRAEWFEKEFENRFIEVGVAEQNLATLGAGFAAAGKVPFIASYACFSPGRNYEQIRTTIALNQRHVIICGMHGGVSVGPDGATHQMLEDLGLMRALPHMTVLNPVDAEEARKAVVAAATLEGPVYIRFYRANTALFTTSQTPFAIGKALTLWADEKPQVALLATGPLSYQTLLAARALSAHGIGAIVQHHASVKPLDNSAILDAAKRAGRILTIEEHQVAGGFGSAVAELLGERYPVPIMRIGIKDEFGQSGEPNQLLEHYGLTAPSIVEAARAFARV